MRFSGIGVLVVGLGVLWVSAVQAQQVGFTQADRERMVRMETTLQMFMESTNRCFTEQREDINQRFEQVMLTLQMIAAVFTAFFLAMLGYAWWDRRTIVRKAKEDTLEALAKRRKAEKCAGGTGGCRSYSPFRIPQSSPVPIGTTSGDELTGSSKSRVSTIRACFSSSADSFPVWSVFGFFVFGGRFSVLPPQICAEVHGCWGF